MKFILLQDFAKPVYVVKDENIVNSFLNENLI